MPAPPRAHPFRQSALWSLNAALFFLYLTLALYLFQTSPRFRDAVVSNANTLFALPYVLSLLVVAVCLAPCAPPPPRDLDPVIASPLDCLLVLLVLLEWATCLALVLLTLIAVHDGLTYISPDGLIVPAGSPDAPAPPAVLQPPPHGQPPAQPGHPSDGGRHLTPPEGGDGISPDAVVVLLIPLFFMYTLFNFLIHFLSCVEAAFRRRRGFDDLD